MIRRRRIFNFWWIVIITILIFAAFQLFNPIKANAPTGEDNIQGASEETGQPVNFQEIKNGMIEASVLMYHHIGPLPDDHDKIRYSLTVSQEDFESQLKYLKENNFNILTLGELEKSIAQNKVPVKPVIITFDDGYEDNFIYAKPILEKYGFWGTFFIISSKIGQAEYMSEEQIKELAKGNEIGSHSYSHPSLVRLSNYYLERELKTSKDNLQALIGKEVVSFCYPAGKFDDRTVEKLKEFGYNIAVTTEAATGSIDVNNLLLVPRYRIAPEMNIEALLR